MSETFVIAARLRLKKKAVTAWLRDAPCAPKSISGWSDMFAELDPDRTVIDGTEPPGAAAKSVRHVFAGIADDVASTEIGGLVAAWDGSSRSFLFYHVMIGWQPRRVANTLTALATAANHWTLKKPATVLLFAETSGSLWAPGAMTTVSIEKGQAGVVAGIDLDRLIADLAPAEAAWRRSMELGLVDAMHQPDILQAGIRQLAKSPLLAKRKRVVPTYETADEWLAALAEIRFEYQGTPSLTCYASLGRFEKDIMKWASQVVSFGAECEPRLLRVLDDGPWEPAVVALWACNALSIATGDGRFYLNAIDHWHDADYAHQGWARGEVTDEIAAARRDHKAALANTPKAGRTFTQLLRGT